MKKPVVLHIATNLNGGPGRVHLSTLKFSKNTAASFAHEFIILDEKNVKMIVEDQGFGFKEKNTNKIFERFYSNRPEKFGEHSGLGLNIVRNLVEVHGGSIIASNRLSGKGAKVDINFPELLVN